MHDIALYRALNARPFDAADALPHLVAIARAEIRQRIPFFGLLEPAVTAACPETRAAALRLLGGATGHRALRTLTAALDDAHPLVGKAAVEALSQTARHDPARYVHALFHPDANIRRTALDAAPRAIPRTWLLKLALDPALLPHMLERHARLLARPEALPILLELGRREQLDVPALLECLTRLPWDRDPGSCLKHLPFRLPRDCAHDPQSAPADPIDAFLHPLVHTRALLPPLFHKLEGALARGALARRHHKRLALSIARALPPGLCPLHAARALAFAARRLPRLLLAYPAPLRRAALTHMVPATLHTWLERPKSAPQSPPEAQHPTPWHELPRSRVFRVNMRLSKRLREAITLSSDEELEAALRPCYNQATRGLVEALRGRDVPAERSARLELAVALLLSHDPIDDVLDTWKRYVTPELEDDIDRIMRQRCFALDLLPTLAVTWLHAYRPALFDATVEACGGLVAFVQRALSWPPILQLRALEAANATLRRWRWRMRPDAFSDLITALPNDPRLASLRSVSAPRRSTRQSLFTRTTRIALLKRACLSPHQRLVEDAALRLLLLKRGPGILTKLITLEPPHLGVLLTTVSLWPQKNQARLVAVVAKNQVPARVRLLLALALGRCGHTLNPQHVIDALCAEPTPALSRHQVEALVTAFGLEPEPLLHATSQTARKLALSMLAERPDPLSPRSVDALRTWVRSTPSMTTPAPRVAACERLAGYGDNEVLPARIAALIEASSESLPAMAEALCTTLSSSELEHMMQSFALAGEAWVSAEGTLEGLKHARVSRWKKQRLVLDLLEASSAPGLQQRLLDALQPSLSTSLSTRRLADVLAWGVGRGVELASQNFRIRMIGGADLGYTRLHEPQIFVNPLPLLQREQNGQAIVEGLILHEIGHHLYHTSEGSDAIWKTADEEGLGKLLNLVADEHLERNLRARDATDGDRLKALAAYAFQHHKRSIRAADLIDCLGLYALPVLTQQTLGVARSSGHIELETGGVFYHMEAVGMSFARFVRALRMGLGDRHNDPRVAQALQLFDRSFRRSTMDGLLEIARKLRDIFGADALRLLEGLGPDTLMGTSATDLALGGEGLTEGEMEEMVTTLLDSDPAATSLRRSSRDTRTKPSRTINLSSTTSFPPLSSVERLTYDPTAYRQGALEVARPARQLRDVFTRLGVGMAPQKRRTQGRRVDPVRVARLVTHRDPRVLISRNPKRVADLYLGVLVDCSASMSSGTRMPRARSFATLLAEATRGVSGVDTRFWGFNDKVLYDMGDASRCAAHALTPSSGNNDAGALWHAAAEAKRSPRSARLLIMISDGSPSACSVASLRALVHRLGKREQISCAQVAVRSIDEVCFPHYIEVLDEDLGVAVRRFRSCVESLVWKTLRAA